MSSIHKKRVKTNQKMAIIIILVACFLLYAKSKHFPPQFKKVGEIAQTNPKRQRWTAYSLLVLAAVLLGFQYGLFTGLVILLLSVIFGLSLTIMLLPLNQRYVYALAILSVIVITLESIL